MRLNMRSATFAVLSLFVFQILVMRGEAQERSATAANVRITAEKSPVVNLPVPMIPEVPAIPPAGCLVNYWMPN